MKIREALLKVREDVGAIAKAEKNSQQGFLFRGIDTVLKKVGPALAKHGVNCYPELVNLESRDVLTGGGKRMREVTVTVAYHYVGPEGDEWTAVVPGESMDAGDKAVAKAMSVALRTAHLQTLQIPTGEADPDASSVTRKADPLIKVKQDIWAEAAKRWPEETHDMLMQHFAEWSGGTSADAADLEMLQRYLDELRPKRRMKRGES